MGLRSLQLSVIRSSTVLGGHNPQYA